MGTAIVTFKIMPESPEVDLNVIQNDVIGLIDEFTGLDAEKRIKEQPIAFGLVALMVTFVMKEETGSTEKLEEQITKLPGVQSVDVTDVRRALG